MSDYKPIEKLNYTFYKWIHISKELENLCYVGSTANITNRKYQHKSNCNNANSKLHNNLLYRTMRENGGFNNFKMVILGTAEQVTKREALAIEEEYRVAEKATLNIIRCCITEEQKIEKQKQYKQNHKEEIKKYRQDHKEDYKEQKAEYMLQYNKEHKKEKTEYMMNYYQENKEVIVEKIKQYRQTNKEEIAEKKKQYRQANKELLKEQQRKYYQAKKALQAQVEE